MHLQAAFSVFAARDATGGGGRGECGGHGVRRAAATAILPSKGKRPGAAGGPCKAKHAWAAGSGPGQAQPVQSAAGIAGYQG
jgi:hypothetical protein